MIDYNSSSLFFSLVDRGDFAAADTIFKSIEEGQSSRGRRLTLRFVYFFHGYEALKRGQRDTAANVVYALENGHTRFITPDGKVKDVVFKAGEVVWSDGGPHTQETIIDTHVIQIELKPAKK